jgi:hypothetical protein
MRLQQGSNLWESRIELHASGLGSLTT